MCGICGVFDTRPESTVDPARLKAMADTIEHRGPDDEGFYCSGGIGLAHRRLSIIDVSGGHQPLSNESGDIWVVFNGEIYNFDELNRQYLSTGHTFRTRSDTETIVHLYEELGEECFAQMRGMFAIALWDGRRRKLILARDRIGKKPLYYAWDGRRLIFGSEIKALWPAGGLSTDIDYQALSDYFAMLYVPAPKTIYRQVRKLMPGHYMTVDAASGMREVQYWDLQFDTLEGISEAEWCERFLAEYQTAVKLRLISDVPLGAFLSGGIDSSSVVALMSRFQPPVTTCSIGFAEQKYDEAARARQFAASLGANHHEQIVAPKALDLIPKLAWHYDEPFADSSAVPTYYVSQVARQHVTVALSGDGGDENFAGYGRYKLTMWEHNLRSLMPASVRANVFGPLGRWYPKLGWAPRMVRFKSTFQSLARDTMAGYFYSSSCTSPEIRNKLLTGDLARTLGGYDPIEVARYHYSRAQTDDPLSRILYLDIKTYLVDDILVKVDRASMANALEVRSPLLDHKLMELIAQIPSSLKLHNNEGKYIFKQALRGIVPEDILYRRKQGFSMPVAEWFRGELKGFTHDSIFRASDGLLNNQYVRNCWDQHQRRQRDWSALLWCLLMFRMWQDAAQPKAMKAA